jgi:anti-sigma28 factor (negative regulator of flagellin synthesis)
LADKILQFRPRGTATPGNVEPRQTDRACAVVPLPDRQATAQAASHPPWPPVMPSPGDIDSILVAVLRDRVARGEYRVDPRTVARKLIAAHGL